MGVERNAVYVTRNDARVNNVDLPAYHSLVQVLGNPVGNAQGIAFDFQDTLLSGTLYYGLIHYNDSRHPLPVYFRSTSDIVRGKSQVNISGNLSGRYDMTGWEKSGEGTIGYRVVDTYGSMIYDGRVAFKGTGPFELGITVTEGPFINLLTSEGVTVTFKTNLKVVAKVTAQKMGGNVFPKMGYRGEAPVKNHPRPAAGGTKCGLPHTF